jgi:DNA-binding NtrC family response regulator
LQTVLVVDDEAAIRKTLEQILTYESYHVLTAASGPDALDIMTSENVDVVFLDIKMQGMDGFEVLEKMSESGITTPVIVISGHGNIETAVEAVKKGAFDFLEKPLDRSRLLLTLRNCISHRQLQDQTTQLRTQAGFFSPLIGESPEMMVVKNFIERVSPTDATVLITGENGTGKEVVARALHANGPRCEAPLIEVNCAAIPKDLVESELFGHEKGSFTGADKMRVGKFEQADGGTLFLDEIGDMTEEAQAKVLKAVEEQRFQRVGGQDLRKVDVRIIAATNRDLASPESGFRQDLYFRLNVLAVNVPALRERGHDVEILLAYFMEQISGQLKKTPKVFTANALAHLKNYAWPGNVRELRNLVERLMILVQGGEITVRDLPMKHTQLRDDDQVNNEILSCADFQEFKSCSETLFLQAKLEENGFNISKTAEKLGMQRSNLYKKIDKYGLNTRR